MKYLDVMSKTKELFLFPRQTIQYHGNPVYAPTSNAEEAEVERFYEDLLEKAMAPHSSTLAWKIPWTEEPGRLQSVGSHRVRHN